MSGVFSLLSFLSLLLTYVKANPLLGLNCSNPTPPGFESQFKQNCGSLGGSEDNCNSAYNEFLGAFVNRSTSNVMPEDYNRYLSVFPITADPNQSLFWSGTISLVSILSMMNAMGVNVRSSENTISSKILADFGDVCWCSAPGIGGLLLENTCPNKDATTQFWAQFSTLFAQAAKGTVFYLTDGERMPAYNPLSFFGCIEIPNLNTSVVNRIVTLNIHRNNTGESCSNGASLSILEQNVTSRGLNYACYDLYGQANNTSQLNDLCSCAKMVIGNVQMGTEGDSTQIDCRGISLGTDSTTDNGSGTSVWTASLLLVFIMSLLVSTSML